MKKNYLFSHNTFPTGRLLVPPPCLHALTPLHLFSARSFSSRSCCIFSSICRRLQCSPQLGLCSLLGLVGGGNWFSFSSIISSICCFSRESSLKKDRNYEHQSTLIFLPLFLPGTLLSSSTLTFTSLIQIKTRPKNLLFFFFPP